MVKRGKLNRQWDMFLNISQLKEITMKMQYVAHFLYMLVANLTQIPIRIYSV